MTATICIDWGSTNLRAWLIEDGLVRDERRTSEGLKALDGVTGPARRAAFERLFEQITEGWRDRAGRALLSGMVTSRAGWLETPYLPVPARLADLIQSGVPRRHAGLDLVFLPGLSQRAPADVIRGEEVQLAGIAIPGETQLVLAPGTHSKWVVMEGESVQRFRTLMTGEIFDLVRHHSLAGALAAGSGFDDAAFFRGLDAARSGTPLAALFQARAGVLLGQEPAEDTESYLSGVLIGAELAEGVRLFGGGTVEGMPRRLALVGTTELTSRYDRAMGHLDLPDPVRIPDASAQGFARLLEAESQTHAPRRRITHT